MCLSCVAFVCDGYEIGIGQMFAYFVVPLVCHCLFAGTLIICVMLTYFSTAYKIIGHNLISFATVQVNDHISPYQNDVPISLCLYINIWDVFLIRIETTGHLSGKLHFNENWKRPITDQPTKCYLNMHAISRLHFIWLR